MMQSGRIHRATPDSGGAGSGGTKFILLLGLALLVVGLLYLFLYIQTMMFKSRFGEALSDDVMETVQYERLTAARVRKHLRKAATSVKLDPSKVRAYITLQPRDQFKQLGSYHLERSFKGYRNVQSNRTDKIPGCSLADALAPGTTIRDIAGASGKGKASMMNRAGALMARDSRSVVTGNKPQTTAPAETIVFSIDVVFEYKYLIFKRKMWFHRRCYFYEKRRRYTASSETAKALGKSDD